MIHRLAALFLLLSATSTAVGEGFVNQDFPTGTSLQSAETWGPAYRMLRDRAYMSNEGRHDTASGHFGNHAQSYFGMGASSNSTLPSLTLSYYDNTYNLGAGSSLGAIYRYIDGTYGGTGVGKQTNNTDRASPTYWPMHNVPLGWLARESRQVAINTLAQGDSGYMQWLDYAELRDYNYATINPKTLGLPNGFRNATNYPPIETNYFGYGAYTLGPDFAPALGHFPDSDALAGYWTMVDAPPVLFSRAGFEIRTEDAGQPAGVFASPNAGGPSTLVRVTGGSFQGGYADDIHTYGAAGFVESAGHMYITDIDAATYTLAATGSTYWELPATNYGYVVGAVADASGTLDGSITLPDFAQLYESSDGATGYSGTLARVGTTLEYLQDGVWTSFTNAGNYMPGTFTTTANPDLSGFAKPALAYYTATDTNDNYVTWSITPRGYRKSFSGSEDYAGTYAAYAGVVDSCSATTNLAQAPIMTYQSGTPFVDSVVMYTGNTDLDISGTLDLRRQVETSQTPADYRMGDNIVSGDLLGPWLIQDASRVMEHVRAVGYPVVGGDYVYSPAFHYWTQANKTKEHNSPLLEIATRTRVNIIATFDGAPIDNAIFAGSAPHVRIDGGTSAWIEVFNAGVIEYALDTWADTESALMAIYDADSTYNFSGGLLTTNTAYTSLRDDDYHSIRSITYGTDVGGAPAYVHFSDSRLWLGDLAQPTPNRLADVTWDGDTQFWVEGSDGFYHSDYRLRQEATNWTIRPISHPSGIAVYGSADPDASGLYYGTFLEEAPDQSITRLDTAYAIETLATNESSALVPANTAYIRPAPGAVSIDHDTVGGTYNYTGSSFVHTNTDFVISEVALFSNVYQQVNPPDMLAPTITPTSGSVTNATGPMTEITISGTYPYMPDGPLYSAPYLTVDVAGYATRVFGITDVGGAFTTTLQVPVATNAAGTAVSAKLSRLASWPYVSAAAAQISHGAPTNMTLYNTSTLVAAPDAATTPGVPVASVLDVLSSYDYNRVQLSLDNYNELEVYGGFFGSDLVGNVPAGTLLPAMPGSGATSAKPVNNGWTNTASGASIDFTGLVSSNTAIATSGLQVTLEPGVYVKTAVSPFQSLELAAHHDGPVSYTRDAGPAGADDTKVVSTLDGYADILVYPHHGETNPVSLSLAAWTGPYTVPGGTNEFYLPAVELVGGSVVGKSKAALADQVYPEAYAGSGFYVFTNSASRVDEFATAADSVDVTPLYFVNGVANQLGGTYTGVGAATGTLTIDAPPYWYLNEPGFDGAYTATTSSLAEVSVKGIDLTRSAAAATYTVRATTDAGGYVYRGDQSVTVGGVLVYGPTAQYDESSRDFLVEPGQTITVTWGPSYNSWCWVYFSIRFGGITLVSEYSTLNATRSISYTAPTDGSPASLLTGVDYTVPAADINDTAGMVVTLVDAGLFQDDADFENDLPYPGSPEEITSSEGTVVRPDGRVVHYNDAINEDASAVWFEDAAVISNHLYAAHLAYEAADYTTTVSDRNRVYDAAASHRAVDDLTKVSDAWGYGYTNRIERLYLDTSEQALVPGDIILNSVGAYGRGGTPTPAGYAVLAGNIVVDMDAVFDIMYESIADIDESLLSTNFSWPTPQDAVWTQSELGVGGGPEYGTNNVDGVAADFEINWRAPQ